MEDTCPLATQVMVAIPAYTGTVSCDTLTAVVDAVTLLAKMGVASTIRQRAGECYIDLCRNALVAAFLASDASHLLFVDADVGFPASAVARLLLPQKPFIAGLYPKKTEPAAWPVEFALDYLESDPVTGLLEASGVPTGFLLLHRSVFAALAPHVPVYVNQDGEPTHAYFQCEIVGQRWWGEDFNFCRRWRAIGGKVWIDPYLTLTHVGAKRYSGSYVEWFINRQATVESAL